MPCSVGDPGLSIVSLIRRMAGALLVSDRVSHGTLAPEPSVSLSGLQCVRFSAFAYGPGQSACWW